MRKINLAIFALLLCLPLLAQALTDTEQQSSLTAQAVIKPSHQAIISSEIPGKIANIPFKEGQAFKAGDLLIAFDCNINKAQLKKAQALLTSYKTEYQANQRLSKMNAISKVELAKSKANVDSAKADFEIESHTVKLCHIIAPYAGHVVKLDVHEHESVQKGTPLISILDNANVDIEAIIPSDWLSWLTLDSTFTLHVNETNKNYPVKITRIIPKVDAVSQSIRIIGHATDNAPDLIAGMSGQAEFHQE